MTIGRLSGSAELQCEHSPHHLPLSIPKSKWYINQWEIQHLVVTTHLVFTKPLVKRRTKRGMFGSLLPHRSQLSKTCFRDRKPHPKATPYILSHTHKPHPFTPLDSYCTHMAEALKGSSYLRKLLTTKVFALSGQGKRLNMAPQAANDASACATSGSIARHSSTSGTIMKLSGMRDGPKKSVTVPEIPAKPASKNSASVS